jgi:D-threonine aldolase
MMYEKDKWYEINNTRLIDSPALIVYPERVKENIRTVTGMIDDVARLRPHIKTHKTKEATLLMMEAGINKFKCATIAEAEMLGMCGAKDVLLAYPLSGPKVDRFIGLIKEYFNTHFSCLVDNIPSAINISNSAIANDLTIDVYVDLNIGMNRTGIKPGKSAIALYEECARLKGIEIKGFHAYDGHINESDMEQRTAIANKSFEPVKEMVAQLAAKGYNRPNIIIGGSPTFPIYAKNKEVECGPGTFIFWDKGYSQSLPEQKFLPAALVLTRVVSLPDETKVCIDLGHKAIASENELKNRVYFLNAPNVTVISHSEEHMVLEAGEGHAWKPGDVLYAMPIHICPTCALYDLATIVHNGQVTGTWEIIARKRRISC